MTSPNIRFFKSMAFNYGLLAWMSTTFSIVHIFLGKWIWVWVGAGIAVGSMYVALCAARELDAQKEITKAIAEGRQEKVDALYNRREK